MHSTHRNSLAELRATFRYAWGRSRGSLSLAIVWVCVIVFVLIAFLDRAGLMPRTQIYSLLGVSYIGVVQRLWFHQFLTSPLLHGGIGHLLFNMLTLWMLGPGVEKAMGRSRYAFFSILCAISGTTGFLLFNWGTGNIAIGYSGVIYGILVAQAMYFPDTIVSIYAFFPLKMKYAVVLLGAVELYLSLAPEKGGIAHATHLFGAVAAFVYLKIIRRPSSDLPTPMAQRAAKKNIPAANWQVGRKSPGIPKKI